MPRAAVLDRPAEFGGLTVGRGGFLRDAAGVAYVSDPTGALVADGPRRGEVRLVRYGSPSNFGQQVENLYNLAKWGERRALLGVGLDRVDPIYVEVRRDGDTIYAYDSVANACAALVGLDADGDDYKMLADRIAVVAKDAAKTNLAADQGTHAHAITEIPGDAWFSIAERGELLGIPRSAQQALVDAWWQCVEADGLELLATEAACVNDDLRLAGTLDHIARLRRALRFVRLGGEIVEIPAGTVIVVDKKSGRRKIDERTGAVAYWQSYGVQVYGYAGSRPYDLTTQTRGEWGFDISREHAVIAHLDIAAAIEGRPACELVHVDLAAAGRAARLCAEAKAWDAMNQRGSTTFSVARAMDTAPATPFPAVEQPAGEAHPAASPAEIRRDVQTNQVATAAREGATVDDADIATLRKRYDALGPEAKAWVDALVAEGRAAGVAWNPSGLHSVRRFELGRAVVALADDVPWSCAEFVATRVDIYRGLLGEATGRDEVEQEALPLGAAIGTLDTAEAARFAVLVDEYLTWIPQRPEGHETRREAQCPEQSPPSPVRRSSNSSTSATRSSARSPARRNSSAESTRRVTH
jgi:hypothetical protein